MLIRFICPNGHKLSCPGDRAGRTGKCPECETLFQVPKPPEGHTEGPTPVLQAEQIIEFYCPNEHYLQSPARLQGKRGQCPQCGETFRVPKVTTDEGEATGAADSGEIEDIEDIEEIEEAQEQLGDDDIEEIEEIPENDTKVGQLDPVEEIDELPHVGPASDVSPPGIRDALAPPPPLPEGVTTHPLAWLFERIWEICDPEAVIELELEGGERLAPLHFSHELSLAQHAVFATQNPDSTHTITVLDWNKVVRVTVRGLKDLPPQVFG